MTNLENKNYPNIGQSFIIVGIIILLSLLVSPINFIFDKFISKDVLSFITYVLSFGIAFWIVYSIRKHKTNNKTFNLKIENKRTIPVIIIAIIALNFGIIPPIISSIPMPESVQLYFANLMGQYSFITLLTIVIAAPILEELIFRGIILDGLLKNYSPIKSILITSVLFGLAHLNPWQFISAFSLGAFISWIYYKTGSLSLAIIIHSVNNLGGFLIGKFSDSDTFEMNKTVAESYGGILNLVLILLGSILIFTVSVYFLSKELGSNNPSKSPLYRLMKVVYILVSVSLLVTAIFIINNSNQDKKQSVSVSLEDCYQKNIETSTLMTGWYCMSDNTDNGFIRQMNTPYTINPFPIVTAEDMVTLTIQENDYDPYLLIKFGKRGTERWREATKKSIGKNILFIVNDELLSAPLVKMEMSSGISSLYGDYTIEELEIIKQAIEKNKTELKIIIEYHVSK